MLRGPGAATMTVLALACLDCRRGAEPGLVVDAAASTTDALREIGAAWQAEGHPPIRFSFGASSELARQIEAGAKVDVFLSADVAKMDAVQGAGLVRAGDRRDLLGNQLVVVVPAQSSVTLTGAADLEKLGKIATGETTTVPIGIYARDWLGRAGVWQSVASHVVATVDVRGALAAVESQSVDAAIVYRTDALISPKVRVAYVVPIDDAPKIVYPVARIDTSNAPSAAAFVDFLAGPEARRIFEAKGFVVF